MLPRARAFCCFVLAATKEPRMVKCLSVVALVLGLAPCSALAQSPALFGAGLSFMSDEGTGTGFAINVSKDLGGSGAAGFGPVGDFSLHRDSGFTWTTFGGGIRLTGHPPDAKVMPFGQFLVGASSFSGFGDSSTHLSLIFGGGIHVALSDRLNLLFQFDLVNVRVEGDSTTGKRTTIGISIPLGAK